MAVAVLVYCKKIILVLSTLHCVSVVGLAANSPPPFDGVEVYPIKLPPKKKNALQRLCEPL